MHSASNVETEAFSISSDHFKCALCLDIVSEAVATECCNQLCCKSCIVEYAKPEGENGRKACPLCRKPHVNWKPSIAIQRVVDELPVNCSFCAERKTRGTITDHERKCENRPFKCNRLNCDFVGQSTGFLKHLITSHAEVLLEDYGTPAMRTDRRRCRERKITCSYFVKHFFLSLGRRTPFIIQLVILVFVVLIWNDFRMNRSQPQTTMHSVDYNENYSKGQQSDTCQIFSNISSNLNNSESSNLPYSSIVVNSSDMSDFTNSSQPASNSVGSNGNTYISRYSDFSLPLHTLYCLANSIFFQLYTHDCVG